MGKIELGNATLYCGDCLDILPTLPDNSVDAVVTDPPYSSGGILRSDRVQSTRSKYQSSRVNKEYHLFTGDNRDQRGFLAWSTLWLSAARKKTTAGGIACIFSDWRQLPITSDAVQAAGFIWRGIVPWDKVNSRPMPDRFRGQCEYVIWGTNGPRAFDMTSANYHPGILKEIPPPTKDRQHSTQKPVGIMRTLCKIAPEGGVVLDPFMGSGTTGVAAILEGRPFIGIEQSPEYFEIAKARIEAAQRQQRLAI